MFVCSLLCMYLAILAISKATQFIYIFSFVHIMFSVSYVCLCVFLSN